MLMCVQGAETFHQTVLMCVQGAGTFPSDRVDVLCVQEAGTFLSNCVDLLMCVEGAGTFPSDLVDVLTCVQGAERGLPAAAGDCGLGAGGARDPGLHGGKGLLCAVPA